MQRGPPNIHQSAEDSPPGQRDTKQQMNGTSPINGTSPCVFAINRIYSDKYQHVVGVVALVINGDLDMM